MSDEYVLKSQKYLNSMYGGHPSWVTLQENGNTGTLVKSLGKTLKKPYFMGFFYILRFWFRNRGMWHVKSCRIVTIC